MSRPSQPKPLPDCRKCQHRGEMAKGAHVECLKWHIEIPWGFAMETNLPCPGFRAGPRRKKASQ